jgi:hypothetical protein
MVCYPAVEEVKDENLGEYEAQQGRSPSRPPLYESEPSPEQGYPTRTVIGAQIAPPMALQRKTKVNSGCALLLAVADDLVGALLVPL